MSDWYSLRTNFISIDVSTVNHFNQGAQQNVYHCTQRDDRQSRTSCLKTIRRANQKTPPSSGHVITDSSGKGDSCGRHRSVDNNHLSKQAFIANSRRRITITEKRHGNFTRYSSADG